MRRGRKLIDAMPAIHISEAVFSELVEREGGYQEAKERVKEVVRGDVE